MADAGALVTRGLEHLRAGQRADALFTLRAAVTAGSTDDHVRSVIADLERDLGAAGEAVCAALRARAEDHGFGTGRTGPDPLWAQLAKARIELVAGRQATDTELLQAAESARFNRQYPGLAHQLVDRLLAQSPGHPGALEIQKSLGPRQTPAPRPDGAMPIPGPRPGERAPVAGAPPFTLLARAAIVCKQRFGDSHRVARDGSGFIALRNKRGFRVDVRDSKLVVTRHQKGFSLFAKSYSDSEIAGIEQTVRTEVDRRTEPVRCPTCWLPIRDQRCVRCHHVELDGIIAMANLPIPDDLFDPHCPWCGSLAEPWPRALTYAFRCACSAVALGVPMDPEELVDDAINLFKIPLDHPLRSTIDSWHEHFGIVVRHGGSMVGGGHFTWFKRV